ncbi:hypothetical protein D3C72_1003750 [compost metagenome]
MLGQAFDLRVGVGVVVVGDQVEVGAHRALGFQLHALRLGEAALREHLRLLFDDLVLLAQVVHRGAEGHGAVLRLVLDARFPLLAAQRREDAAFARRLRRERLAVAQVRRPARGMGVHHAQALGGGAALLLVAAGGAGHGPVMAQAGHEDPVVELDLVLQVQAGLALAGARTRHALGFVHVAVHRRVEVDGVDGGAAPDVLALAREVRAHEQRVLERAGLEVALDVVVQGLRAVAGQLAVEVAGEHALEDRVGRPAVEAAERAAVVVAVVVFVLRVAEVLAHGPAVVELVLELPAEGLALAVVVVAGLADEAAGGHAAVRVRQQGAFPRQELRAAAALVFLPQPLQRERGRRVGPPGERGRDHAAVVGHVVDLRIGLALQRDQPVRQRAIGIQRTGQVGLHLLAAEAAELHAHLALGLLQRPLADHVDHARRGARAEQHARGAAQHFEALQRVGLGARRAGVVAVGLAQAIEVDVGIGAAHADRVGARVDTVGVGAHARRVVEGVLQVVGALVDHLVARDHGDGLRRFRQRRVGLGGGDGVLRAVADHGRGGGFGFGIRIDAHFGQRARAARLRQNVLLRVDRQAAHQHRSGPAPRPHSCHVFIAH